MNHAFTPFDEMANTYDADFTSSGIGLLQRQRVWSLLTQVLKESAVSLKILEINCGTGEDAIMMARSGHQVIATDASPAMIGKAMDKANGLGIDSAKLQFIVCPFEEISRKFEGQKFDLIFSDFGGLNCINKDALKSLCHDLRNLTGENGKLFLVLLGKYCLWEIAHYSLRGKFSTAFRRLKRKVNFSSNGFGIQVYYYSPGNLKKICSPGFSLVKKFPVGLFIPPSYLNGKYATDPVKLKKFEKREGRYGYAVFANLADHYCAIFNKNNGKP